METATITWLGLYKNPQLRDSYEAYRQFLDQQANRHGLKLHELENEVFHRLYPYEKCKRTSCLKAFPSWADLQNWLTPTTWRIACQYKRLNEWGSNRKGEPLSLHAPITEETGGTLLQLLEAPVQEVDVYTLLDTWIIPCLQGFARQGRGHQARLAQQLLKNPLGYTRQADLARELGVNQATISRHLRKIAQDLRLNPER